MAAPSRTVEAVAKAATWDARVALIRKIPEQFGLAEHQEIYATIAQRVYVPNLAPDFAYIHWRDEYGLAAVERAYDLAHAGTSGFPVVDVPTLAAVRLNVCPVFRPNAIRNQPNSTNQRERMR